MPDSNELDQAPSLPRRNWVSIVLVLVVQSLNSFSDNFVKMLLIALSIIIAKESWVGRHMELWLGAIFSLPYLIFAPLAGYWSDRFSKRNVIVWMQVMQLICFVWLAFALWMQRVPGSLEICLVAFFVLAVQAAVLSPAKMGVMKELAGSRRLGRVSGWLQVTMLAGILGGMWAGGMWYGKAYERTGDAWMAALWPLIIITVFGVGELVAALCIQKTPAHPEVRWRRSMAWEHFDSIKIVFRRRSIRLAALGVTYFWFVSNAISFILVTLTKELHPDTGGGDGPMELAKVAGILGIGVISGSFFASHVSRNRIEMGLIPLGGFGLVAGLLWSGLAPLGSSWMYAGIIFTGAAGGCFMVPLYAFAQDKAEKQEKARIHAGMNLMDCLSTLVAVAVVALMKWLELSASTQFLLLAIPTFAAAAYTLRLLPNDFVRFLLLAIVRMVYHVKPVHAERVPSEGGVLLLCNHVSYMDAFIIGAACRRHVRFVIWDELYHIKGVTGFLRLVGSVPISPLRAKDGIRAVAAALKEGEMVCLFPEGQITRHGMVNDLRKGFEIMARQAGAMVVPAYLDGLYGSIFSFQGGRFFSKMPRRLRYPASVLFGQPMAARDASAENVRTAMLALGSQAMLSHRLLAKPPPAAMPGVINALRLSEVEWRHEGDVFLCLEAPGSPLDQMVKALTHIMPKSVSITDAGQTRAEHIVAFTTRENLPRLSGKERLVFCIDSDPAPLPAASPGVLRGYIDPATSILLSVEVPDPPMPENEPGGQLGRKAGSLGRLLPGFNLQNAADSIRISGLMPGSDAEIHLPGVHLDDQGFLVPL
jgi:acyl-[acyl-carrier-protein]-phospholipid O-acyltransferase/long-chain-fatty-acid--[acyl-carrier-protein] ligase